MVYILYEYEGRRILYVCVFLKLLGPVTPYEGRRSRERAPRPPYSRRPLFHENDLGGGGSKIGGVSISDVFRCISFVF